MAAEVREEFQISDVFFLLLAPEVVSHLVLKELQFRHGAYMD